MIIVRYAAISSSGSSTDAMRKRLEVFSLSLHPDKTRPIEFGRHAAADERSAGSENRNVHVPGLHLHLRAVVQGQVPA
jgi:hypothetical protein